MLVSALRDAIVECFPNPKVHTDPRVVAAYQISRIMRNAFAHAMLSPVWSIDADCSDKAFEIEGVLSLNTTGLHGRRLDWRDYGGPVAVFRFGRFVREVLLNSPVDPDRELPPHPSATIYQIGRTVAQRMSNLPDNEP